MFHYYTFINDELHRQDSMQESTQWIHLEAPDPHEISELIANYQLPRDYVTAILDDAENSRCEQLKQPHFAKQPALVLVQFPRKVEKNQYETYPLSIIFTHTPLVITVSKFPPILFDTCTTDQVPFFVNSPEVHWKISFPILWCLSHSFNLYLKEIKLQLQQIEQQIKVSTENQQLYYMLESQKSLVLIESATKNNLETLMIFSKSEPIKESDLLANYMQDILIETKQSVSSASIHLRLIDQINNTFSAIVSNNLNNVMKFLTSLTLVLTIPTIIGGIYGMNVTLPFEDSKIAFWLIALITASLCITAITILKKKNLL